MYLCIPWKCDSVIYLNTFFPFLCITLLFKLLIKIVVGFSQYFIVCSIRCILTNFCYNLLINIHSHIYIYKCSETHHMIWPTVICPPTIPCRLTVFSYMTHNYHLTIILITSSITKLFLNQPYLHFPLFQFIPKTILSIEISFNKTHVHDSNIIILYVDSSIRVHKLILFYMYMYNISVLIRNILPRKVNVDTDVDLHGNLTICLAIHLHLTFSILYISISVPSVFTCVYLILLPTCIVNVVELTRVRCYSRKQLISFLKRISESIIGHYDVFPIFHYLLEHTSLKRSPYLNWRGCSCRPTTLHPNHDVRQACEIIIIPIYILLCVFLAYKCLLCMCSEYVQRTGQYFYRSNFNPLIITHNSNSNLLRKCQPKLEVQTLCYKIKYLKVNFKQINCLICNNTSLTNYDIFNTFKLPIIYFRDLHSPFHEVKHYTCFVFEMSLFITCYISYSYISLMYFIKRRHNLLLILSVHHTCYISMFRLYRTVILFIMHFVREVFNLPHLYR